MVGAVIVHTAWLIQLIYAYPCIFTAYVTTYILKICMMLQIFIVVEAILYTLLVVISVSILYLYKRFKYRHIIWVLTLLIVAPRLYNMYYLLPSGSWIDTADGYHFEKDKFCANLLRKERFSTRMTCIKYEQGMCLINDDGLLKRCK